VIFSFVAEDFGTKVIEVYFLGERIGATYIEVVHLCRHLLVVTLLRLSQLRDGTREEVEQPSDADEGSDIFVFFV
jgi:hypothetical protein